MPLQPAIRIVDLPLEDSAKQGVERGRMIEVHQVYDFVRDDRAANEIRREPEPPVKATAPKTKKAKK